VCNLTAKGNSVNAKSILGVLTLGVNQGHRIRIDAEGDEAEQALSSLNELVESNFGEA
jgi:phosphocarrier protein